MPPPHTAPSAANRQAAQPRLVAPVSSAAKSRPHAAVIARAQTTLIQFCVRVEKGLRRAIAMSTSVTAPRIRLTATLARPESVAE